MLVIVTLLQVLANAAIGDSGLKLLIHDLFRDSLSSIVSKITSNKRKEQAAQDNIVIVIIAH